ncbi:putative enzyme related to lactoylglutathione lyase [Streptomyces netropsis]|uniref:Catechol 2,3-dioxygenase-like lactoylglutathione lyase family enzyme n=1 Tax=Streptomyces syringium TaxID=76729 RepID=A0ABS4Y0R9_9ACTN|nr:VOC family protein [Streptomyces syringium]MBP2402319.1 catechol 2,3-dioxygenase-like lactoylglutathione lyase family enzyme [Streptomyces syringium]SPE49216.1 putative enzyme related to lactoylglutathione lyase [Streptomyces netropsis]
MIAKFQCTVIDCPDPAALAAFYAGILGWRVDDKDPEWVWLTAEDGRRIAFQLAEDHRPPRWPDPDHPQQMHLDFDVPTIEDMERAQREVIALGATFLHDSGGERSGFRVFSDPAGHPFCLCYGQELKADGQG